MSQGSCFDHILGKPSLPVRDSHSLLLTLNVMYNISSVAHSFHIGMCCLPQKPIVSSLPVTVARRACSTPFRSLWLSANHAWGNSLEDYPPLSHFLVSVVGRG